MEIETKSLNDSIGKLTLAHSILTDTLICTKLEHLGSEISDKIYLEMEDEAEIGIQTIKVYGDSVGVTSVPEEAAKYLASEVTFLLKEIVQDASKVSDPRFHI